MGPKPKRKQDGGKGKDKVPPIDPDEIVTELMKEFFEVQLADIEKKIIRLTSRQEELKAGKIELEEKIEEYRKEKGAVITEHEQILALKEDEKMQKRDEMNNLSVEIKTRVENHKKHVIELQNKFNEMVVEVTKEVEELDKEVKVLEDFKFNKDYFKNQLQELERQIHETEIQHQRNLFSIQRKCEMAKVRVKKELGSRLILLSIEFQKTTRHMIGNSCHRVTQENKAIENEIKLMKQELEECQEKLNMSEKNVKFFKTETERWNFEKDKAVARTLIQVVIIKKLLKDRNKLLKKLNEFANIEAENRLLLRKKKNTAIEMEVKAFQIEEYKKAIEEKHEEINNMKEAMKHLKKNSIKLQIIIRNALKVADEALAIHIIPMGGTDEEKLMNNEARLSLFKKRRDSAFAKKGKSLQSLLDILAKAQLKEEDKKLLTTSSLTINLDHINFSEIYGKAGPIVEKELELTPSILLRKAQERSRVSLGSDVSLPRSVSDVTVGGVEGFEEELGEHEGEFESEHSREGSATDEDVDKGKMEEEGENYLEQEADEKNKGDASSMKEEKPGQAEAEDSRT